MLKSHFNLQRDDEEEQKLGDEHSEHISEVLVEEEKIVYPERKLNKSEVSIRMSMLGKTADGDGYNLIQDIRDFNFPNLDSLYLAGNKITSLVGIEKLVNLRILHIRNNPIKLLNGLDSGHAKLQYVNLRNCKVTTLKQVNKLKVLKALDTLILKGCPYMGGSGEENAKVGDEEDDAEVRVEILAALPRLKRLNKGVLTPEEKLEAKDLMNQWLEEGGKDEEEIEEEQEEESNPDE